MQKVLLIIFFSFVTNLLLAQSFIQPCISDTRIDTNDACPNWQTSNYGTISAHKAATWTYSSLGCGRGDVRFMSKFDLNPPVTPQALYDNRATFNLYYPTGASEQHWYSGGATDNQFYIKKITSNWLENTVTWDTQPTTTTVGQITVPSCSPNPSTQDYHIDVSTLVLDWICGGDPNYGFKMILVNEGQIYRMVNFASRDYSDSTKHPTLSMEYAYIAATGPDTICEGDTFNINCALNNAAIPANYSYQWTHLNSGTPYATQNLVSPTSSLGINTYVVTVSNPWCQTAKDTVEIFVEAQAIAFAGNDTAICNAGQNIQLTATGGTSYSWSNGGNTASINVAPLTTTTYVVTVSNGNCSATDDVIITVGSVNANAGNDTSICVGQSMPLAATGGSSYSWSNGGNTATINVTPTITTTYVVTVSSGNCSATDDVVVIVNSYPIANAGNDTSICENNQAFLLASGGATYIWSNGATTAANIVNPLVTTTYIVTVSNGNCSATDDVLVTVNPQFDATITTAGPYCINDILDTLVSVNTGGIWSGTGINATTGEFNPFVAGIGTHQIIYTITAICGDADTIDVIVNDIPQTQVSGDTICNGEQASVSVSGGSIYLWNNGNTNSTINVNPIQTTSYTVTVTDVNNCQAIDSVQVIVNDKPQVLLQMTNAHCGKSDGSVTANVSGGNGIYTYSWSPISSTNPQINNIPAGNYSVTVTSNSCSSVSSIIVADLIGVQAQFSMSATIVDVDELVYFYDHSIGATSWYWTFGDGNTSILQNPTNIYSIPANYDVWLYVEDNFGCKDSTSQALLVKDIFMIYIPNSFTPNGDGINDVFIPFGTRIDAEKYIMQIYDRWGKKVFETTDIKEGWDGTVNGKPIAEKDMMTAVFVYYIYIVEEGMDADREYRGSIHLIR